MIPLPGFSLNAVSSLLLYALGFLNQVLLARFLSPSEYGQLAIMATAVMFGGLLLGEWLQRGGTYVVGHERAEAAVTGSAMAYCASLAVTLGCSVFIARVVLAVPVPVDWAVVAGIVVLHATQKSGQGINLGAERLRLVAVTPLIMICAYLCGNVVLVLLYGGLHLRSALWVWLGAMGLSAATAFLPALRAKSGRLRVRRAVVGRTLAVGARGAVSAALVFLLFRGSIWLLGYLADPSTVASFRVALTFADMMQRLPNVAGMVLLAHVVRGQDREGRLSLRVAQTTLVFSLLVAVLMILLGRFALAIAFPLYPEAYLPLICLLPGLVCTGAASVLNTKLAGAGYPPVTLWAPATALLLLAALTRVLVPRWGLAGAAAAASAAYVTWSVLVARAYLAATRSSWRRFLRWDGAGGSIQ